MPLVYPYIGPEVIREQARGAPAGAEIRGPQQLAGWIAQNPSALEEGATFVVMPDGALRLAPRRSEHVACAGGEPVSAAGELRFARQKGCFVIAEATNQSTGYCPEPASFAALGASLAAARVPAPAGWTHAFLFRRCPACALLNLVKEGDFSCAACQRDLPRERNLLAARVASPHPAGEITQPDRGAAEEGPWRESR